MNLIAALFISAWLAAYCQRIPDPEEVQLAGNSFVGTLPPIRLDQRSSAPCLDEEISIYTRDGQFGPGWLSGSRGTALEIESDRALFRSQDDLYTPLCPSGPPLTPRTDPASLPASLPTGRISAFVSPFSELSFRSVRAIGDSLRKSRSRTLDLTKSLDAIDDRPQEIDAVL